MYDFEIDRCLKQVSDFIGVFPRDKIPDLKRSSFCLVVNNDKASEPGSHWVAFKCNKKFCEYFDSFGIPPLYKEFRPLFKNRKLIWNGRCVQHFSSKTCGEFCVSFLKSRNRKENFNRFINQFNKNLKVNDKKVIRMCYDP